MEVEEASKNPYASLIVAKQWGTPLASLVFKYIPWLPRNFASVYLPRRDENTCPGKDFFSRMQRQCEASS